MLTCPACSRTNPAEASFCMGCGGPLGATATAHETRKTVTALFCDLVGSTTLGEQHDPEVLRPLLDRYFAAMREAVERHGGRVEKFIGDAVSAVFGLPAAHEDDALRAVRAGMEMQARLAALNAGTVIPLAARIGITTGEVLVPGGGAPLIGDTMNTASRLQSSAVPGSVVIGEPTFRLVRDAVVAEPVESLVLRGKTLPVRAYRVVAVASLSPMRTRRLDAPMVGRRREASLLADAFERAASDRACVLFTVLGSAGAGKSRLVEEFLDTHADGDAEILRGRCLPYGDGITWYPITEALRGALGFPEFAEADAIRAAISEAVAGEEHAAALVANLAPLFAVGPGGTAEETAWAIRRFLESRGRKHPLVVVFDDIHWGEPAFLDLVEHLADWTRDAAILLLCMARPDLLDVRATWGGGKTNAATISLAPLTTTETDALIDGLLGSSALPAEVRARITAIAEGNPLFVEEMLRMLVDDGRLVRDDGCWAATGDLADVAVPPTVSALLSARLDRLSDGERAVVEAASVAGKEFHRGSVTALLPEAARPDISVPLRSLTRKELITPERSTLPGEDAYRFRHLLIRDAAYDAIPKSARSELHRAFADWLERAAGERVAEQQEILGYHLERAYRYREELGLPEDRELRLRAGKALGAAGARALDRGDVRAGVDLLRPAAELAHGDRAELEILDDLRTALEEAGEHHGPVRVETRLAEAAAALGDPVYLVRARHLAYLRELFEYERPWDAEEELALTHEALGIYRAHGAARLEAGTTGILVGIEGFALGRAESALAPAMRVVEMALAVGDRRLLAYCISNVMTILEWGPTPLSASLAQADAFLERWAGDVWMEAILHLDRAWVAVWLGRPETAEADLAVGRSIGDDLGWSDPWQYSAWLGAYLPWLAGNLDRAVAGFRHTAAELEAAGNRVSTMWLIAPRIGQLLLELGRDGEAAAVVDALEQDSSFPDTRASKHSLGGVLAARRGDHETAVRLSDQAARVAGATDLPILQADVALDRAEILLLAGRHDEALASATDALEKFERKEYAIGIRRARAFLAALDAASGTEPA